MVTRLPPAATSTGGDHAATQGTLPPWPLNVNAAIRENHRDRAACQTRIPYCRPCAVAPDIGRFPRFLRAGNQKIRLSNNIHVPGQIRLLRTNLRAGSKHPEHGFIRGMTYRFNTETRREHKHFIVGTRTVPVMYFPDVNFTQEQHQRFPLQSCYEMSCPGETRACAFQQTPVSVHTHPTTLSDHRRSHIIPQ